LLLWESAQLAVVDARTHSSSGHCQLNRISILMVLMREEGGTAAFDRRRL
jgi:hypothetical protein